MVDDEEKIVTIGDFHRRLAKSWLTLPGIKRLPKFHKLCKEIVRNGNAWQERNRAKIREIEDSRDVKLFLIRKCAIHPISLIEDTENANDPELRQAASDAVIRWSGSDEGARLLAEHADDLDWISANIQRIGFLYKSLPKQPATIRNNNELGSLFLWSRRGEYEKVNKALDHRLSEIKAWWKRNLGIAPHRSLKAGKRVMYRKAALMKAQGLSWREVAHRVDPDGYRANSRQCIERIRKGVGSLQGTNPKEPIA